MAAEGRNANKSRELKRTKLPRKNVSQAQNKGTTPGSLKVEIKLKSERAPGGVYLKLKYLEQKGEPNRRLTVKNGRVPSRIQRVYPKLSTKVQLREPQSREKIEE